MPKYSDAIDKLFARPGYRKRLELKYPDVQSAYVNAKKCVRLDASIDEMIPQWVIDVLGCQYLNHKAKSFVITTHNRDIFCFKKRIKDIERINHLTRSNECPI